MSTMIEPRSNDDTKVIEPLLRFPEFDGTYQKHLFDDLFEFSTGKNIKQNEASPEFKIPCVRYGELYHMYGEVISKTINFTNLSSTELKFSKGNEILLPSAGEDPFDIASASALALKDVAIGRTINILSPQKEGMYSPFYMSYYINQKQRKKISRLAKGVSISNVYNSDLKKLSAVIPDIQEQQKIADFLSSVDKKIEQLTEKYRLLTEYKKGIMQQIFTQQIRFKDNQGHDYPEWEVLKAEHLFCSHSNKKHNSELPILAATQDRGVIPRSETGLDIQSSDASVASYKVIEPGDFLISLRSFQGGIEYSEYLGICSPAYTVLKPKLDIVDNFYKNYFKKEDFISRLSKTVVGIRDGKQISYGAFSTLKLPYPCVEEQQKIANFLTEIDRKIDQACSILEQTKTSKKGLLQKMFV